MPGGRPSKLTQARKAKLTKALKLGATYKDACAYAGIGFSTFRKWMIKGEGSTKGQYRELFDAVKKAEAEAVVGWLSKIEKAAKEGSWQAAAWKLERRYPEAWGRRSPLAVDKPDKGLSPVTPAQIAPEEFVPVVKGADGEES